MLLGLRLGHRQLFGASWTLLSRDQLLITLRLLHLLLPLQLPLLPLLQLSLRFRCPAGSAGRKAGAAAATAKLCLPVASAAGLPTYAVCRSPVVRAVTAAAVHRSLLQLLCW